MAEPYRDGVDAAVDRAQAVEAEIKDLLRRRQWTDVRLEVRVVVSGDEARDRPLAAEVRVPEGGAPRDRAPLDHLLASAASFVAAVPVAARLGVATAAGGLIGGLVVLAALQGALFAGSRDGDRDIVLVHSVPFEEVEAEPALPSVRPSREVWIESDPTGADVYIDGAATGLVTPAQVSLAAGRDLVWVRVEREGYDAAERQVEVGAGAAVFHLRPGAAAEGSLPPATPPSRSSTIP